MPLVLCHSTSALVLATLLLVGVGVNMVRAGLAALTLLNGGVAMIKTGIATLLLIIANLRLLIATILLLLGGDQDATLLLIIATILILLGGDQDAMLLLEDGSATLALLGDGFATLAALVISLAGRCVLSHTQLCCKGLRLRPPHVLLPHPPVNALPSSPASSERSAG